jgi:uncharacterized protein YhbP (UPF0306 family)
MRVLSERWVLTLALADPDHRAPYPTPLFYALAEPDTIGAHPAPLAIFASDPASRHGELCGEGPSPAAAAVYLESEGADELRGAQLRGRVIREQRCRAEARAALRARYLERHPIAEGVLAEGRHSLYVLQIAWAKLTDNRLGFGRHPIAEFGDHWDGLS